MIFLCPGYLNIYLFFNLFLLFFDDMYIIVIPMLFIFLKPNHFKEFYHFYTYNFIEKLALRNIFSFTDLIFKLFQLFQCL